MPAGSPRLLFKGGTSLSKARVDPAVLGRHRRHRVSR
jgi:predicted nucleotidyltransferase component of viral defense system